MQGATKHRIRRALPSLALSLGGAALWGLTVGGSALFNLLWAEWATPAQIREVALIFLAGGILAFPVALYLARFLAMGRGREVAFAALFVCLLTTTIGLTGGIYALQYRLYYSEWHGAAFTKLWLYEYFFTVAVALYQFAVLGVRLYFPTGFIALFLFSLWFARRRH